MLTFPLATITSTQFSTLTDVNVVVRAHLDYLCTNFIHDESPTEFRGTAAVEGHTSYEIISITSTITSTQPFSVEFTVAVGTYDPNSSTGSARLTSTYNAMPIPGAAGTSLNATCNLGLTLQGTTAVTGMVSGTVTLHAGSTVTITASERPYSLALGAGCS